MLTIEDGTAIGGFGDAVLEALAEAGVAVPVRRLGLPDSFIEHGAQPLLLHKFGLDARASLRRRASCCAPTAPAFSRGSRGRGNGRTTRREV